MDVVTFISALKHCKEQAIIFHHNCDTLSEHKATEAFYTEILELLDGLIESYQGIYPKIEGYMNEPFVDWESKDMTIKYFQELYTYVQDSRTTIMKESWLQNQIDEIAELVSHTIYMLKLN